MNTVPESISRTMLEEAVKKLRTVQPNNVNDTNNQTHAALKFIFDGNESAQDIAVLGGLDMWVREVVKIGKSLEKLANGKKGPSLKYLSKQLSILSWSGASLVHLLARDRAWCKQYHTIKCDLDEELKQ